LLSIVGLVPFAHGDYVVTQPNNNSNWTVTKTYNITWQTLGLELETDAEMLFISLYLVRPGEQSLLQFYSKDNGVAEINLNLDLFTITTTTQSDWQIKIENAQDDSQYSLSEPFTIIYPQITVSNSDNWLLDANATASWNTTFDNSLISVVSVYLRNTVSSTELALGNLNNTGNFTWYGVSSDWVSNTTYQFVVKWAQYPAISGASRPFYVAVPTYEIETIQQVPTGGELTFSWKVPDVVYSSSVWLQVPGIGKYSLCPQSTVSNCSIYPLPFWLLQSSQYQVTMCWDKYPYVCGNSNNFNITALVQVDNPTVQSPVVIGAPYNITWRTQTSMSSLSLSLYRKYSPFTDGVKVYDIYIGNSQNSLAGAFVWKADALNNTLETGDAYFLRVTYTLQNAIIYGVTPNFSLVQQSSRK
jgi:hypothetical protein